MRIPNFFVTLIPEFMPISIFESDEKSRESDEIKNSGIRNPAIFRVPNSRIHASCDF